MRKCWQTENRTISSAAPKKPLFTFKNTHQQGQTPTLLPVQSLYPITWKNYSPSFISPGNHCSSWEDIFHICTSAFPLIGKCYLCCHNVRWHSRDKPSAFYFKYKNIQCSFQGQFIKFTLHTTEPVSIHLHNRLELFLAQHSEGFKGNQLDSVCWILSWYAHFI